MTAASFTYAILRYAHDPVVGEHLNIGAMVFCQAFKFVEVRFEHRYERLSSAFSGFNGDHYRKTLYRFENFLEDEREKWVRGQGSLFERPNAEIDLLGLLKMLWPDVGLSFQTSEVLSGITNDPAEELEIIFERFITSQHQREAYERRTNDEVWAVYRKPLTTAAVLGRLRSKRVATADFVYDFGHAFKNGKWHLLEPLSLDYSREEYLQDRATKYLGIGTALADVDEIEKLYLLLGKPRTVTHATAYEKAKHLLSRMPVSHSLIEEEDAERFAREIALVAGGDH